MGIFNSTYNMNSNNMNIFNGVDYHLKNKIKYTFKLM